MPRTDALVVISALRDQLDDATDTIMTAAETGLGTLASARAGGTAPVETLEVSFTRILEACAFQDLAGQRLTRLAALISDPASAGHADPLLEGPQSPGAGLSQAEADALMDADRP